MFLFEKKCASDGPQTPLDFKGFLYATGYVNMTWISGFEEGYEQFFVLSLVKASEWKVIGNITEPAEGKLAHFDPGYLTPGQEYRFHLNTCNVVNCSEHSAEFELTFKGKQFKIKDFAQNSRVLQRDNVD